MTITSGLTTASAANSIILTVSNTPPATVGQPIYINGSAHYSALPVEVKGGRTTYTLVSTVVTTFTTTVGTYATNFPAMAAGTYTVRVCVTDFSLTTCSNHVFAVAAGSMSNQTITFPLIADQNATNAFGLAATASSGLPVAFSVGSGPASIAGGTNLSFTGTGTVRIVASQAGDASWNPAPNVTNTFAIFGKTNQTISFPAIGNQVITSQVGLAATASSGLPVTFAVGSGPASIAGGTNLSFTATGTVRIVASQAGDANWNPALNVTNTFLVNRLDQTIAFPPIADQHATNKVGLAATASSGLPVAFAVGSGPASITGGTNLSFTATGTVRIVASQAGDANWNPAPCHDSMKMSPC